MTESQRNCKLSTTSKVTTLTALVDCPDNMWYRIFGGIWWGLIFEGFANTGTQGLRDIAGDNLRIVGSNF